MAVNSVNGRMHARPARAPYDLDTTPPEIVAGINRSLKYTTLPTDECEHNKNVVLFNGSIHQTVRILVS